MRRVTIPSGVVVGRLVPMANDPQRDEAPLLGLLPSRVTPLTELWGALTQQDIPALLCGPRYMGRRYLVRAVERRWIDERAGVVARAHFDKAPSPRALADELGASLGLPAGAPDLLAGLSRLAARVGRPLLVEVDGYEAVVDDAPRRVRFLDALRNVAAHVAFGKLAVPVGLLLLGEGRQSHLTSVDTDYEVKYFREWEPFELGPLTEDEVGAALGQAGLDPSLGALWAPTGGVGGLLVPALEHAARRGEGAKQLLQRVASPESPFAPVLGELRGELRRDPEAAELWADAVRYARAGGVDGPDEAKEKLFRLGLVVFNGGGVRDGRVRPRCDLFARHLGKG
jgi:hypothetical protein